MRKPFVIPVRMPWEEFELINNLLPDNMGSDRDSFEQQIAKKFKSQNLVQDIDEETGELLFDQETQQPVMVPERKPQTEFTVYASWEFILRAYDVLAQFKSAWVANSNEVLESRLRSQLSDPEIVQKLMEYNMASQEEVISVLTQFNAGMEDLEKKYSREKRQNRRAGWQRAINIFIPDANWPV